MVTGKRVNSQLGWFQMIGRCGDGVASRLLVSGQSLWKNNPDYTDSVKTTNRIAGGECSLVAKPDLRPGPEMKVG
jgi:hypothetical protein